MPTDSNRLLSQVPTHASPKGGIFILVFIMLCGLTAMSFWIANSPLMENRSLAWGCMLAVSVAKAILVVLFFMHLWWERAWKYVLIIPAMTMGSMLVLLLVPDIALRTDSYSNQRREAAPAERILTNGETDVTVKENLL